MRPSMRTLSRLRPAFRVMFDDLEANRLVVALAPDRCRERAHRGLMLRVVDGQNPAWYRKLCEKYPSRRVRRSQETDTKIRRIGVLSVLGRLSAGLPSVSKYVPDLYCVAKRLRVKRAPVLEDAPF